MMAAMLTLSLAGVETGDAFAGGPRWVAGSSYFDSNLKGKPVVWRDGQVRYYTDLGDLSGTVSQAQANAMVAMSAAIWSNVAWVRLRTCQFSYGIPSRSPTGFK